MYINSTVKSLTPVQVIWDFKYYKVSKKINSCIYMNVILQDDNESIRYMDTENIDISYLHHKRPIKLLGLSFFNLNFQKLN